MSDRSSSPEPILSSKKADKSPKDKSKKKSAQPTVVHTPHGKNEGTNAEWAYQPPAGTVVFDGELDEDFDWDSVKDDEDLELWVVRVPEGVKPKHLQNLKLDAPSANKTARIGSLERKAGSYDVWSLGDEPNEAVAADEMRTLQPLLPRKKKGTKFYAASDLPVRRVVLSARPPQPSLEESDENSDDRSWATGQNPPRPAYPKEMLKHRFLPIGAETPAPQGEDGMDVDVPAQKPSEDAESKPKKRKVEGSTKKSKKSKSTE
ncbi:DNA-directed RNA polymerase I subunit RPA34.5-domain-containing protein [Phanerochaete sordida]|uniref:DNA-directed RNA polymerase I subunit RPA34.5-domain-containing protein n=1 Tax=Phanerochaete sordida TaxID=48140 RepID=A0A9P3G5N7_9APHY|nr:DNA-directed RNA polymerase I subunit RPA34.5-domain-containing protein [Phanerochaete sordida]